MPYVQIDFPGKNNKVVCTTYVFLQELAITQKFKMTDMDNIQLNWPDMANCQTKVLIWIYHKITVFKYVFQNVQVFCTVWVKFCTHEIMNNYEIKENNILKSNNNNINKTNKQTQYRNRQVLNNNLFLK